LSPGGAKEARDAGTYSESLLHIVFSTRHRHPGLTADVTERLYPYIRGIVREEKGVVYDLNGIEDHLHVYLRWRPDVSISDLMRIVKANSSKWIHQNFRQLHEFAWQEGYSAFTVSKSQEPAVKRYIQGQAEHHKHEDFKSELLRLLRAHGAEFDERYVFD
jgi:REP element-mobilizing transposase RayT